MQTAETSQHGKITSRRRQGMTTQSVRDGKDRSGIARQRKKDFTD
jgi:hypothetical protein